MPEDKTYHVHLLREVRVLQDITTEVVAPEVRTAIERAVGQFNDGDVTIVGVNERLLHSDGLAVGRVDIP